MILAEGRNCWRIARANRAGFLVDAAAYFASFREAVARARRTVVILGWDIDSRVRLVQQPDGAPVELLPFLNHVLARRPGLRVFALGWDFSVIYTFERESLPVYRFALKAHPRLTFRLDDVHPVGGAHHQKVVVVDDRVAFTGGLDLTIRRWDTPAHAADDPGRIDPAGQPYAPMHDVQMVVDGEAARALGDLARARWLAATGWTLPEPVDLADEDPWPTSVAPEMRDVPVGIARTIPAMGETAEVTEVMALTLDAIRAARRWIYIENQYLTSAAVGHALAARLAEPDGPEVLAVLPREEHGWLEQRSLGIMRARLLRRLKEADRHARLRLYYPAVRGLVGECLNVHSKVLVVDDALARVGSSNLTNRSMGIDTECDVALDAALDPGLRGTVASLRDRLLAEHLGTTPETLSAALAARGSLIGAVEALRGGARSLEPIPDAPEERDAAAGAAGLNLAIMDGLVCDPERPAPDRLIDELVPTELRHPVRRALLRWGLALAAAAVVIAVWRLTPVRLLLDVERMAELGRTLRAQPAAPLLVLAAYACGALLLFPITLLLAATALIFEPARALVLGLTGALVGAAIGFGIGRLLGRPGHPGARWLKRPRVARVAAQLQRRGTLAVVTARMLPIGNFSLINIVAGALGIRFRDFVLGNVLGLLPGLLGLTLFADRLGSTIRNPQPGNILVLIVVLAAVLAGLWWLRRRLTRAAGRRRSGS